MEPLTITKSLFLKGMNCVKYIPLHFFQPEMKNTETENTIALENGRIVGLFGHELYKGGIDLTKDGSIRGKDLIRATSEALQSQHGIFYEAAFASQQEELTAQIDVLVLSERNNRLVEFKSSTKLKLPHHIYDLGFQWKVIKESGFSKKLKYYIAYLNRAYVRAGGIDIEQLFVHEDVTTRVDKVQILIDKQLEEVYRLLDEQVIPNVEVGMQCFKPYPCEFQKFCWEKVPNSSIQNIGDLKRGQLEKLQRMHVSTMDEIPRNTKLSEQQWEEVDKVLSNKLSVNHRAVKKFIKSLDVDQPLTFMDFETEMPAIPRFDGCRPYEQIPFQYCVLYRSTPIAHYQRKEFLAKPGDDPRTQFIENLLIDTDTTGTIIVYNESFEKSRLKELAELFPEYEEAIYNIISRIKDLCVPFKEKLVWHPRFKGKYSLKVVLPILCPDLNYDKLSIRNGSMAMEIYGKLNTYSLQEQNQIIKDLREYCYTDVLAMVRILEVLEKY